MKSFFVITIALLMLCCNNKAQKKHGSPDGYNLDEPSKLIMPESLLEISGISFHNYSPDTIYAIQDEQGKLFKLPLGEKEAFKTKFGKQGDYEDLAILNNTVFVLKSNGSIYSFPFGDSYSEETYNTAEWKNILPDGEYESLYADSSSNKIYALCKHCGADKKSSFTSGYIFNWKNDSLSMDSSFRIDISQIEKVSKTSFEKFRPSAMAKNPLTQEWYILASLNKILVITDSKWQVKQVFSLDGTTFNQPEGIAFDNHNNLYISNEGSDIVNGNVLRFDFSPKK